MKDGVAQANDMLGQMASDGQKAQYLMQAGRVGTATVSGVRQTGTFVNNNPECELDLQVVVDGGAPVPGHAPPGARDGRASRASSRARRCPSGSTRTTRSR